MKEKFLAGGFLLVLLASAANALEIPKELPVYKLVSADGIFEDRAMTLSETFLGDFRGNVCV